MKRIIITEAQNKRIIREFMQDGFSLEQLNSISRPSEKFKYCTQYLGHNVGCGSSRVTFEIDDERVLKLAHDNEKNINDGIEQNEQEYILTEKSADKYGPLLFPKVYEHANDWSWIIVERVEQFIPEKDCVHILGIPWYSADEYQPFVNHKNIEQQKMINMMIKANGGKPKTIPPTPIDSSNAYNDEDYFKYPYPNYGANMKKISLQLFIDYYSNPDRYDLSDEIIKKFEILRDKNQWFEELFNYISDGGLDLHGGNFGIALRDGKPALVIIDSGITPEIFRKYYNPFFGMF